MTNANLGEILVADGPESLARIAAHLVRGWIWEAALRSSDGTARIAISGGSTPRAMSKILAGMDVPWERTEVFWVDDRAVPFDSPRSNYGAAREDLFSKLLKGPKAIHPMYPVENDAAPAIPLADAARAYEAELAKSFLTDARSPGGTAQTLLPTFDVVLLGIGDDGHTASLFPGDPYVDVFDRWVVDVPAAPGREARLTLTRPILTAARRVVVLAQGAAKKTPITQARSEGPLREIPSRITRECRGQLLWLVDAAARP